MYTFCYKVLSSRRQIPNRLSLFSVFNCRYSVFFGIVNTDVGVGTRQAYRYFKISDIGSVFRYTDPRLVSGVYGHRAVTCIDHVTSRKPIHKHENDRRHV